ncbi:hypothetical protein OPT61_g10595 [Boeremia exigua]|uniref:Uncharacterized protein n=1 Tax=Boeremia exigua TaxID=749465 RepID=A0ACC2HPB4_9PLEO|nr:hypothetical protein OPT61_g10595 [Boeremia exigua]
MEFTDPYVILQGDQVYGIWVFADPPPASTADCRTDTASKIMQAAEKARLSREAKEQEGKNGVQQAAGHVEPAASTPMGRQLSLRELFGQQRQQDAGFSVHDHHSQQMPQHYPQQQPYMPAPDPGMSQQDVLGQLFLNAKQNYNGQAAPVQQRVETKAALRTHAIITGLSPDAAADEGFMTLHDRKAAASGSPGALPPDPCKPNCPSRGTF